LGHILGCDGVSRHVLDQVHEGEITQSGEHRQPQNGERQTVTDFAILPSMGSKLRALREERGWTHEKAAEEMGVSRSQFIKLERGERRLTADYINQAAK